MTSNSCPLVSITILCFNHEKYISEAIESCLQQTYKNIEIVIVDNGSTDNTKAIIQTYAKHSELIRFLDLTENSFPSYASNLAIKEAQGEYIALLSGDDFFEENKIEQQLNFMLEKQLSNSFTWVNTVNDSSQITEHSLNTVFNQHLTSQDIKNYFVSSGNTLCAPTAIFHRHIFDKYGFFDNRLLQLQDYEFWLRVISSEDIHVYPQKLTNYRVRDDGSNLSAEGSEQASRRTRFETIFTMKHIINFDFQTLSSVTDKACTPENVFKNLFNYYQEHDKLIFASGLLFYQFDGMDHDIQLPNPIYSDFLEIYSSYTPFENESLIKDLNDRLEQQEEKIKELQQALSIHQSKFFYRLKRKLSVLLQRYNRTTP